VLGKGLAFGVVDPRALVAPTPTPIIEQTPTTTATNARTATEPKCSVASAGSRAGSCGRAEGCIAVQGCNWPTGNRPSLGHNVRQPEPHTRRALSLLSTVSDLDAYTEGAVLHGVHPLGVLSL
jgi:hypothetical protein